MKRSFKTTAKHIFRSPFQALAAISVLTITFFMIAIFSLIFGGSEKIIRFFETRPQVIAFFKDNATSDQIDKLKDSINKISGVVETRQVSKEEALVNYREQNKNDPLLLEMVTADILPASLEVRASNPGVLFQIADLFKSQDIVEEVIFQKDIVENLSRWTRIIRYAGLGSVTFLLLSSMLTIMVIIGMKISSHKTEIEIIRLLGGGGWQIISPFVYEGMIYGAVGSLSGWILAWLTLLYSTPVVLEFFGAIPILPAPAWFLLGLMGGQLLLGILVGFISSTLAARHFLKS